MTFLSTTWEKKRSSLKVFIFDTTHSSKGRNKTLEWLLLLISTLKVWRVESCSGAKQSCKVERKQGWFEKMDDICEEAVPEVEFFQLYLLKIKILKYIPRIVSSDLDPWKFINGLRYNPNAMCLSMLHFFHFTTFWIELKNINMILKQLHKTNASKGSKKMKYYVG